MVIAGAGIPLLLIVSFTIITLNNHDDEEEEKKVFCDLCFGVSLHIWLGKENYKDDKKANLEAHLKHILNIFGDTP